MTCYEVVVAPGMLGRKSVQENVRLQERARSVGKDVMKLESQEFLN
jgi:hypothetical protein